MKVEYEVLFTPSQDNLGDADEVRAVVFTQDRRLASRDEIRKKSRSMATRKGTLDEYALRNFWEPACCEMTVVESPWSDVSELADWCENNLDIHSVVSTDDSWHKSSAKLKFASRDKRAKADKELRSMFGNTLPLQSKANMSRITLRAKANINTDNIHQVKNIYEML